MASIKVRFHLGKGVNFMKWKIEYPNGYIAFLAPEQHGLILHKCKVKNHSKTAQKIFSGADKAVCAWILCEQIEISVVDGFEAFEGSEELSYNPRITPNWMLSGENADGKNIDIIYSAGKKLYVL